MGELLNFRRSVNGVPVEQRIEDGFINGTAMCAAHGKAIKDWVKTRQAWDFLVLRSRLMGVEVKEEYSPLLGVERISEIFPHLLATKRGSPSNGGGTWIHHKLAVQLGQWCSPEFAVLVSDWVEEWLTTGHVSFDSDAEQECVRWQQRYDIRIELKDVVRPELMNAVVRWAQASKVSPPKLCSEVHDTMNERIQGAKAEQIRLMGGLPMAVLIRDYFEASPLVDYVAINKLAKNAIQDRGMEPISAVHEACDFYLGKTYVPKLVPISENIYIQGQRVKRQRRKKRLERGIQTELDLNIG